MDDAALVALMARKDPQGMDGMYRRYADRLFAYARSVVGDRESAADIVHDTFLLASEHVAQLRDPGRLRPWLYSIARHEGLRQLRNRSRQAPLETAPEPVAEITDPSVAAQSGEVAELVWAAMAGMAPGDREIAELALRHGLSTTDIAAILEVPENNARARLSRARDQLEISLGVLLVARHGDCAELARILVGWDGKLNPLLRKRLHRHIEGCEECQGVRRRRLNPAALLSAYSALPFVVFVSSKFGRSSRVPGKIVLVGLFTLLLGSAGWLALAQPQRAGPAPVPTLLSSALPESPSPLSPPAVSPVSPSPASSPPSPRRSSPAAPAPLSFTAQAVCHKVGAALTFTFTVTANADLDRANVTSTIGPITLDVSGKTAQGTRTSPPPSTMMVNWSVSVKDRSGRQAQLQNQNATCT